MLHMQKKDINIEPSMTTIKLRRFLSVAQVTISIKENKKERTKHESILSNGVCIKLKISHGSHTHTHTCIARAPVLFCSMSSAHRPVCFKLIWMSSFNVTDCRIHFNF